MTTINRITSLVGWTFLILVAALFSMFLSHWPAGASSYVLTGGHAPPSIAPAPGENNTALGRGLFTYSKTDLTVAAPIPLVINRTYRSRYVDSGSNPIVKAFGNGTSLSYDLYLYSSSEVNSGTFTTVSVVQPDGGQITCNNTCTTNCGDYHNANFVCKSQPIGAAFDSTITYNSSTPGWDWKFKDGTVYSFGVAAPLQSEHDRYGNMVTLTRCSGTSGNVTHIASSNGRGITINYPGNDCTQPIASVTDAAGREVDYTYNGQNQLTQATYPHISSHGYYANTLYTWGNNPANIVNITINRGVQSGSLVRDGVNVSYGGQGNIDAIYPGSNTSWGIQYTYTFWNGTSPNVKTVAATFPNGTVKTLSYDQAGYLTQDQDGATNNNPLTTTITRDTAERTLTVKDTTDGTSPLTRTTTFVYDSTTGDIDSAQLASSTGFSAQTSYQYYAAFSQYDLVKTITNALNKTWTFNISADGKSIGSVTDPMGRTTTASYNAQGQVASITDPLNNPATIFVYSSNQDLVSVTDPLGNKTSYTTDTVGRVTSAASPMRETTSYTYDDKDEVIQVTDPIGLTTQYYWDLEGLIGHVIDSKGNQTNWSFTPPQTSSQWNVQICNPGGACDQYLVQGMTGDVVDHIDKNGLESTYSYDDRGRKKQAIYNSNNVPNWAQWTLNYKWDGERLIDLTSLKGSTQDDDQTMAYDSLDDVLAANDSSEGNVTYQYDVLGRRTLTLFSDNPSNYSISYTWDADNEPTGVSVSGGVTASATINYDADGRRTTLIDNNVTTAYGYDTASRLTSQTYTAGSTQIGSLTYGLDADGRLVSEGARWRR